MITIIGLVDHETFLVFWMVNNTMAGDVRSSVVRESEFKYEDPGFDPLSG